jgi:transposase
VPNRRSKKFNVQQKTIETSVINIDYNISDDKNGILNNENVSVSKTYSYGSYMVLSKIAKELNILNILKKCFPNSFRFILSIAFYIVSKATPLYRINHWSKKNYHPYGEVISDQRVSELLLELNETDMQKFLALWLTHISENEALCYDITSISSYSASNYYIKYGYNRDHDKLKQINLALLFGKETNLPAYFRLIPGNITDVKTLTNTIKYLNFIGMKNLCFILDRGFYSIDNVNQLIISRPDFLMSLPSHKVWIEDIIDKFYDEITYPENFVQISEDETIFAKRDIYIWPNHKKRLYIYIYYQHKKEIEKNVEFLKNIINLKEQIENNDINKRLFEKYSRYLIITNKKVLFNHAETENFQKKYSSFFCLLSSKKYDPLQALMLYRQRNIVENSFDNLKNEIDCKRLRVHSEKAIESRLFLQFIALILTTKISTLKNNNFKLKYLSVRELFDNLETLIKTTFKHKYGAIYSESDQLQRDILENFGYSWPPSNDDIIKL